MVIGAGGTLLAVVAALLAFWPRRDAHRLPRPGAAGARGAVRRPRRGARLRGRVPPRRAAGAAHGGVPAAGEAAGPRRSRRRCRRGRGRDRRADGRAAARRPRALVGLRELGDRDGRHARGRVQLGPRLQPARLAARRPRAAAGQGAAPRVLEGDGPRRVRRPDLASRPAQQHRAPVLPAARQRQQPRALDPGDRGHAAQPPHGLVHHRGHRHRRAGRGRLPDRRRPVRSRALAGPRRLLRGRRLHPAADRAPAAHRRQRVRGLDAGVHHAVRSRPRRRGRQRQRRAGPGAGQLADVRRCGRARRSTRRAQTRRGRRTR